MPAGFRIFRHPRALCLVVGFLGLLVFEKAFDLGHLIPWSRAVLEVGLWEASERHDFWSYLATPFARLTLLGMAASVGLLVGACCWPARRAPVE